jgi:truncated hemoglobin YjbI
LQFLGKVSAMTPLFKRVGGETALEAAVDQFDDRVLADERIKHFFSMTFSVAKLALCEDWSP